MCAHAFSAPKSKIAQKKCGRFFEDSVDAFILIVSLSEVFWANLAAVVWIYTKFLKYFYVAIYNGTAFITGIPRIAKSNQHSLNLTFV